MQRGAFSHTGSSPPTASGCFCPSLGAAHGFVFAALDTANGLPRVEGSDSLVVHPRGLIDSELDDVFGHERRREGLPVEQPILGLPEIGADRGGGVQAVR